jgi:hypothetical protein
MPRIRDILPNRESATATNSSCLPQLERVLHAHLEIFIVETPLAIRHSITSTGPWASSKKS